MQEARSSEYPGIRGRSLYTRADSIWKASILPVLRKRKTDHVYTTPGPQSTPTSEGGLRIQGLTQFERHQSCLYQERETQHVYSTPGPQSTKASEGTLRIQGLTQFERHQSCLYQEREKHHVYSTPDPGSTPASGGGMYTRD